MTAWYNPQEGYYDVAPDRRSDEQKRVDAITPIPHNAPFRPYSVEYNQRRLDARMAGLPDPAFIDREQLKPKSLFRKLLDAMQNPKS